MYSSARKIYNDLKLALQKGSIDIVPTERELCARYSVGRCAVRSALAILEKENMIINDRAHRRRVAATFNRQLKKVIVLQGDEQYHNPSAEGLALLSAINSNIRQLHGEPVMVFSQLKNPTQTVIDAYRTGNYSGVICVEYEWNLDHKLLISQNIPVVITNLEHNPEHIRIPSSMIDFRDIGRIGGRTLITNGCRKIGLLGKTSWLSDKEIAAGLRGALAEDLLQFDPEWIFSEILSADDPANELENERLKQLLASPDRPDGFIVLRAARMQRLLKCCTELDLKIPGDIKVCVYDCPGMCDSPQGIYFLPEPIEALAAQAVEMLSSWIWRSIKPENSVCQLPRPLLL